MFEGKMKGFAAQLLAMLTWPKRSSSLHHAEDKQGPVAVPSPASAQVPTVAGTEPGWLRVLTSDQLLAVVRAEKAVDAMWRQSHQSREVWERDLLPAIHRYAAFVQLMPASEAHHHAHAGGLLSHTIEMVLAALTWRNAMLLPGGSQIEEIDAQRDQWSYVVFFAALLHDIAKPMTDLRIQWRCDGMADSIRWTPAGGSLVQITARRAAAEYLVDFTPKSQRDYSAHGKLAQLLLSRIAPESALVFLAQTPAAMDALEQYLSGQDRDSLVAQLVRRADQASTQRALLSGQKGRFPTSKSKPLIDLLMQAITGMLQAGTELPLNRSGGAAWVFEGAIWFVAKRLADSVREWIKRNEPDEAVPGDSKNDRLFDTWQDYGVIDLNPATRQAIWHVTVQGEASEAAADRGGYEHDLAMLRFPLAKVFSHESKYPAPMQGRLVLRQKRKDEGGEGGASAQAVQLEIPAAGYVPEAAALPASPRAPAAAAAPKAPSKQEMKLAAVMREPAFRAPSIAAKSPAMKSETGTAHQPRKNDATPVSPRETPAPGRAPATTRAEAGPAIKAATVPGTVRAAEPGPARQPENAAVPAPPPAAGSSIDFDPGEAAYLLDQSDFLDEAETAAAMRSKKGPRPPKPARAREEGGAVREQSSETAAGLDAVQATPEPPVPPTAQILSSETAAVTAPGATSPTPVPPTRRAASVASEFRSLSDELDDLPTVVVRAKAEPQAHRADEPQPVLLLQQLPRIEGQERPAHEPSELALDFMRWVQQGLVDRELKFNETGAAVHFVEQGMALVSPLIFKKFAQEHADLAESPTELATKVQREVIKCGWHLPAANRTNIVAFEIYSRGDVKGRLSCVVLVEPGRWVQPVPPSNPALKMI
ncbi:MobH family relaxase [Delftia acidovorans]|uniref:MobH family relaxase n=1 Tax=Delftia acidovorans TaxID=80866 RepID=A0AAJ2R9R9_DELAC|nr:MobH family relaxase [Delftia acidovorans]MDX4957828.1 MobH family relaxase [Delftia acidovorans]